MTTLLINSSVNLETSVTRGLTASIIDTLGLMDIVERDLTTTPLPQLSPEWITARDTPAADRTAQQAAALALSDTLIGELRAADTIVIGAPVYNFAIPAALKAWIDLVARAGETFRYTENGPIGLLDGKRAFLAFASGGTPLGSDMDFASGYMRHMLGFMGITDVTIVAADALALDAAGTMAKAQSQIATLKAAA